MKKQEIKYFIDKIEKECPFIFIDVGAMGGIPLKWDYMLDAMRIIAYEPDPREFSKLRNSSNVKYLNYALHNRPEDLRYYLARESGKSSVFMPNMDFLAQYEGVERFRTVLEKNIPSARIRSLDSIIEEDHILDVDFIKLDTQGSELQILQGGQKKLIPKIFGAQIEVEFIEMYKNQPLFRHIDDFMDNNGFQLIDIKRSYWKRKDYYTYSGKGQLVFGDALYFKKIDLFRQELAGMQYKSYARSKIFKSILTCTVYRIFDYAVAVAKTGLEGEYLTNIEYEKAVSEIKRYSSGGVIPNFHFNNRFYNIINSILQKFKPWSYLGWADSDREIGNVKDR